MNFAPAKVLPTPSTPIRISVSSHLLAVKSIFPFRCQKKAFGAKSKDTCKQKSRQDSPNKAMIKLNYDITKMVCVYRYACVIVYCIHKCTLSTTSFVPVMTSKQSDVGDLQFALVSQMKRARSDPWKDLE